MKRGQLLCEVETEKTTIEITAPASGLLRKILIREGETRPVGVTMGFIGEADEPIPEVEEAPPQPPKRRRPARHQVHLRVRVVRRRVGYGHLLLPANSQASMELT